MAEQINIEVVYGLPDHQVLLALKVELGCDILSGIQQSGIVQHFPEIEPESASVGIFSRAAKLSQALRDGDRIEIYRPLIADPKELRKIRAERAKAEGRASKVTGGRPVAKVSES
ncbi:RnfH family protein [Agarivorans sp. 1_MG-2023]|uniref:RnfH family protein n=1 Tax=Agarivorans sp. 1_MG-2023 TaxID=3062634 RepID=UPI0026E3DA9F|nr:RnfH family protein [Agarivorans sp. 1_MG-2023]MDO6762708.1 RnfH family protein [Agarivorans sp. 1_MG-2023]